MTIEQRDTTHAMWSLIGPEIRHELTEMSTTGPVDFINGYNSVAERNPDFHAEVFNSSATVDDKAGRGTVILNANLSGYTCHSQKAGVILANWRKGDGRWKCVSCFMTFGCPVPPG